MKYLKQSLIIIFSVILYVNVYAGDVKVDVPSSAGRYHLFTGFEFGTYVPSTVGLDKEIADSYLKIKDNENSYASNDYYSIVGHSQGGLRVMAYSTYLKSMSPADYNKLQAVITVSGVDKGLLALDGGFAPLNAKILGDVGTLLNGFHSLLDVIPMDEISQALILDMFVHGCNWPPKASDVTNLVTGFLPDNFKGYTLPALKNADPDTMAEIRDMFPRSDFNRNFIADSKKHDYKVQTGTEYYFDWCVIGKRKVFKKTIKFWGWQVRSRPVYTWYTAYEDFPKFGAEMPYGYIVGLNSNTLSMCSPDVERKTRHTCFELNNYFDIAYNIHSVAKWTPLGWIMSSSVNAERAKAARDWTDHIDRELNELKGSSENDGLVAKESQFFPKSFTDPNTGEVRTKHTNVLGQTDSGYVGMPQYNHIAIDPDTNDVVKLKIKEMITESVEKRIR